MRSTHFSEPEMFDPMLPIRRIRCQKLSRARGGSVSAGATRPDRFRQSRKNNSNRYVQSHGVSRVMYADIPPTPTPSAANYFVLTRAVTRHNLRPISQQCEFTLGRRSTFFTSGVNLARKQVSRGPKRYNLAVVEFRR